MAPQDLTRRALLAALGLAPLAGCATVGEPPLPYARVRAVRLDAAEIAARGLPRYADTIVAAGRPALARAFADLLAPNDPRAPIVTVSVDEIRLAPGDGGGGGDDFPGAAERDEITGRLLVAASADGPAVSRRLHATRIPGDSGPWYLPDIENRRLETLLTDFAAWARREFAA